MQERQRCALHAKEFHSMDKLDKHLNPDLRLAAVCGLYCPSCTAYIGSQEEPARLQGLAARMGRTVDELRCNGCRSDKRSFFCTVFCKMKPCAELKEVTFCGECAEYPCDEIKDFQAAMPHRAELWESLALLKEKGMEPWFRAMSERYACPSCGILNSAYDLKCRLCGTSPGSAYAERHKAAVSAHVKKMTGDRSSE
jgi:hypothetical protein